MPKYKITFKEDKKANDAFVEISTLSESDQNILKGNGLTNATHITIQPTGRIQTLESIKYHNKQVFFRRDINRVFKQRPEPIFKELMRLNNKALWVEINVSKEGLKPWEKNRRFNLGLKRLEYHHYKDAREGVKVLFMYYSLDELVADIVEAYESESPVTNRRQIRIVNV